jgi:hypothetical protein
MIYHDDIQLHFATPDDGALVQLEQAFKMLGADIQIENQPDGYALLHISGCVNSLEQIEEEAERYARYYAEMYGTGEYGGYGE